MVVSLQETDTARVWIEEGVIHIDDFVDTDLALLRALEDSDDPELVVHAILRVGAEATQIARTDFEASVVERRFEGMAQSFDATIEGAVAEPGECAKRGCERKVSEESAMAGDACSMGKITKYCSAACLERCVVLFTDALREKKA